MRGIEKSVNGYSVSEDRDAARSLRPPETAGVFAAGYEIIGFHPVKVR
jgi:hypothetical protein